jgi:hypothetical protein
MYVSMGLRDSVLSKKLPEIHLLADEIATKVKRILELAGF